MRKLKSLIKNFADQNLHGHKLSTRKIYVRFLFDFDEFQQSEEFRKGFSNT